MHKMSGSVKTYGTTENWGGGMQFYRKIKMAINGLMHKTNKLKNNVAQLIYDFQSRNKAALFHTIH